MCADESAWSQGNLVAILGAGPIGKSQSPGCFIEPRIRQMLWIQVQGRTQQRGLPLLPLDPRKLSSTESKSFLKVHRC